VEKLVEKHASANLHLDETQIRCDQSPDYQLRKREVMTEEQEGKKVGQG
jgi:hypothetical protein